MTAYGAKTRAIAAAACLLLTVGFASAQSTKPAKKCKAGSKDPACATDTTAPAAAPDKPASDVFAFPTEDSKHGADAEGEPPSTPTKPAAPSNGLPAMPTDPVPDPPASSNRPLNLPPGSSSSSSSSSSSDSGNSSSRSAPDDDADIAPTTAAPNAPVKASALKDLGSRGDTSEARLKLEKTRVSDDLKIGKFYLQDGNPQGAYLRYKDAVDHAPDDPDARFGLAAAADKLKKKDEAVLNYREYLKLDPEGDHDGESRRALAKLGASAE